MPLKPFPSPHVHIQSFDSASTPKAFVEREKELGTGVLTCTDHGSMACCRKVYDLAKKNQLTPILGVEAYFRDDNCPILLGAGLVPKE
jgi:DNA polymerase-3 subunit alpha